MDLLTLPTGLALLAFAGAAGAVAWRRGRGVDGRRGTGARAEVSPPPARVPAHRVAAEAVIAQAQARAAGPAPGAGVQFEGPGWAATEPLPGIAVETPFADTMPVGLGAAVPTFADTMPAAMSSGAMNFADTLAVELTVELTVEPAVDERPRAGPGPGRRQA